MDARNNNFDFDFTPIGDLHFLGEVGTDDAVPVGPLLAGGQAVIQSPHR